MKYINPARFSSFLHKIIFVSLLLSAANFSYGQCPVPFPIVDADSTLENVPVGTVVTRNDATFFGSGIEITNDSLSIAQQALHGTAVVLNDSTIQYTPDPGFTGTDLYSYNVCDSCGSCGQASVSVSVKPYCPPPLAVADHDTVYNNLPLSLNVTSNDQNIAGGPLTLTILHNPRHGTATVSGEQIIYTSTQSGYVGTDTFVYLERDTCPAGANTDSAFVYLHVITCQTVVAVNDTFSVQQESSVSGNLATNDLHATGFGTTTVTLLTHPKFGGTASVSGTTVTYTGGPNGFGKDSLSYQICTDCGCDTAYAIFRVTQKPCSKPKANADVEYAGYSINCTSIFNITGNDSIPINGGNLVVTLLDAPAYGTASIVNNMLHYTCTDSTKAGQTDLVHYSICNSCFCDTNYVSINITNYPCNGLNPIVNPDSTHVCRNYPVVIHPAANDYSPQGLTVAVQAITGQASHGTAVVLNGTDVQYTPGLNYAGPDMFFYQACDNGNPSLCNIGAVHVYVDSCNAPPVIINGGNHLPADTLYATVYQDSSLMYCFAYTATDSPQVYIASINAAVDTVIANSVSPGINPCVTITPPLHSRTQQTAQVVICTETPVCDTVLLIITVIPVHHAPIAAHDAINYNWSSACSSVNVLSNDILVSPGDDITMTSFDSMTTRGGQISKISDSSLCYAPDSFFAGIDTFRYTICNSNDPTQCASSYVVVTVPVLARSDNGSTQEDSAITISVTVNDTRTAGEYISLCSGAQHGTVAIDSGNIILYTPAHDYPVDPVGSDTLSFVGVDSFCYTICAQVGTDTSCSSAEVYLVILPMARLYIPQGISPNGDGVNDLFVITSADQFPLSQLLVYNRYGDEVWRNDNNGYQNNFDGTWKKNGQPLPDGSYWYIFKFNDGATHDRMGYIVIQR